MHGALFSGLTYLYDSQVSRTRGTKRRRAAAEEEGPSHALPPREADGAAEQSVAVASGSDGGAGAPLVPPNLQEGGDPETPSCVSHPDDEMCDLGIPPGGDAWSVDDTHAAPQLPDAAFLQAPATSTSTPSWTSASATSSYATNLLRCPRSSPKRTPPLVLCRRCL